MHVYMYVLYQIGIMSSSNANWMKRKTRHQTNMISRIATRWDNLEQQRENTMKQENTMDQIPPNIDIVVMHGHAK